MLALLADDVGDLGHVALGEVEAGPPQRRHLLLHQRLELALRHTVTGREREGCLYKENDLHFKI